ncbi:MAG: hypothetical protein ACOC5G_01895 [Acidobacteriota bacterium]
MNRITKDLFTTVINFIVFDYYSWQSIKIFHPQKKEYLKIDKNILHRRSKKKAA